MTFKFPTHISIKLTDFSPLSFNKEHNNLIKRILTNYTHYFQVSPSINPIIKSFFLGLLCFYSKVRIDNINKSLLDSLLESPFYDFLDKSKEGLNFKKRFIPSILRADESNLNRDEYIVLTLGDNLGFMDVIYKVTHRA